MIFGQVEYNCARIYLAQVVGFAHADRGEEGSSLSGEVHTIRAALETSLRAKIIEANLG